MSPRRVRPSRIAIEEVARDIVAFVRERCNEEPHEISSITVARALGTSFNRARPERYVSIEQVGADLIRAGELSGRVHGGLWLWRQPREEES